MINQGIRVMKRALAIRCLLNGTRHNALFKYHRYTSPTQSCSVWTSNDLILKAQAQILIRYYSCLVRVGFCKFIMPARSLGSITVHPIYLLYSQKLIIILILYEFYHTFNSIFNLWFYYLGLCYPTNEVFFCLNLTEKLGADISYYV